MDALAPLRRFDRYQQQRKPLALLVATIKKNGDDQAGSFAVAVAFYAFFSIFPLLLVFVTVLGYVLAGDHALMDSVRSSVLDRFPVIGDSIRHGLKGNGLALILGVLLSLWAGSGVTGAMTTALDHVWGIPPQERASFVKKKLRGLLVLLAVGVLFVIATGASGAVSGGLGGGAVLYVFGLIVSFLVNVVVFLTAFTFLCSAPPAWRKLLPGAVAAGVVWTALQYLGGLYIAHIKQSSSAYGTFALVLGILAWLHLGAQLTMYCAELNTVLDDRRWPRSLFGEEPARPKVAVGES
ncbi:MAG: YihY/virulence factor BrkB family protein [Acidobacteriota bacterium]|nr:YihY/virulence factor BrkB family protein [Acidobacteriota bacterium]